MSATTREARRRAHTGHRAWEALPVAAIAGVGVRLPWTGRPQGWRVNAGQEVFMVRDGQVDTRWRADGREHAALLRSGDLVPAPDGTEHGAHPQGATRVRGDLA